MFVLKMYVQIMSLSVLLCNVCVCYVYILKMSKKNKSKKKKICRWVLKRMHHFHRQIGNIHVTHVLLLKRAIDITWYMWFGVGIKMKFHHTIRLMAVWFSFRQLNKWVNRGFFWSMRCGHRTELQIIFKSKG